jgi:hypothetical protein
VAADARGRIYACDQADGRCQAFDPDGRFLFAFADDWRPPEWAPPAPDAPPDDGRPRALCSGAGTFGLRLSSSPAPLARDEPATLQVELTRGCAKDAPAWTDGVELRVSGWMPRHGHGLATQARVLPAGPGRFRVEGLRLHMSGLWELHFDLFRERGAAIERAQWELELP